MNTVKDRIEHILTLKVMRLTRPTLCSPIVVHNDIQDMPAEHLNADLKQNPSSDPDIETLASGQLMMIPQSFGNIYLGETFSSYMFTHNDSSDTARFVSVRADLQTSSQKINLISSDPEKCPELSPGATVDLVISHEVKEIGAHILICEVTYQNTGEAAKKSFRKFYKFQVLKPLDVKTKIYNAESDEVFMEAQVQNLTTGPINLEKVSLESPPCFKVTCLNQMDQGEMLGVGIVQPLACRQYLYCLAPTGINPGESIPANGVGILDIVWRSNLGERGRLQTSQLKRTTPEHPEVRLSVTKLPNLVKLGEPFSFSCRVINKSEKTMELKLIMEKVQSDMAWIGKSGKCIGSLTPGATVSIQLNIVPLIKGLRHISGVRLYDALNKRTYEYDDLAQVFVT